MISLQQKIQLELLGLAVTAVATFIVLKPIFDVFAVAFPFQNETIFSVLFFLTYVRYMFTLKYTWLSNFWWIKIIFTMIAFPFGVYLVRSAIMFQTFMDEQSPDSVLPLMKTGLSETFKIGRIFYYRQVVTFFMVGSVIANFGMFFRMIISLWRVRNYGHE